MIQILPFLKRITDEHKSDFQSRRISAKALAKIYDITSKYVRTTLPLRPAQLPAKQQKQILAKARRQYRMSLAKKVHDKILTVKEACAQAYCSERNMFRYLAKHRSNE